jgi:HlyD family secretion protein
MSAISSVRRSWLLAGGAGALLLFAGLLCARTPALSIEVAVARRAPLRVEVNASGTVEPVPEAELRVHARVAGRILEIPEPGTRVVTGDVVLEIEPGPVAAELASAESEKLAAEESLRAAQRTHTRVSKRAATDAELHAEGALNPHRYAESRAQQAEARERFENLQSEVPLRVASLDLRIAELRAQLAATKVLAPFDGTVYRTSYKQDEISEVGAPVLWLADLSRLRIRANVDQVDLGRVSVGQQRRITANAWPDREWSAIGAEIVPYVVVKENRSVSESLALVQPPSEGLIPGMTVDVDILVADVADALQVPAMAVHRGDGAPFVYTVVGDHARRTPVELGRQGISTVEILGGVEPEARVVVGYSSGLEDGVRLEIRIPDVAAR